MTMATTAPDKAIVNRAADQTKNAYGEYSSLSTFVDDNDGIVQAELFGVLFQK